MDQEGFHLVSFPDPSLLFDPPAFEMLAPIATVQTFLSHHTFS